MESIHAAAAEAARVLAAGRRTQAGRGEAMGAAGSAPPKCIDCIIHFAGVIRGGPLVEMPAAELAQVMSVNVLGTAHVTKACLAAAAQGSGMAPYAGPLRQLSARCHGCALLVGLLPAPHAKPS